MFHNTYELWHIPDLRTFGISGYLALKDRMIIFHFLHGDSEAATQPAGMYTVPVEWGGRGPLRGGGGCFQRAFRVDIRQGYMAVSIKCGSCLWVFLC